MAKRKSLREQWIAIRRTSGPLTLVNSPDPAQTVRAMTAALVEWEQPREKETALIFEWDASRGMVPANAEAAAFAEQKWPKKKINVQQLTANPAEFLLFIADGVDGSQTLPRLTTIFAHNLNRFWEDRSPAAKIIAQGTWNLRDPFKAVRRSLVVVSNSPAPLPSDLQQDILVLEDPLPDDTELAKIIMDQINEFRRDVPEIPVPDEATLLRAVDAVRGCSAFTAETITAMAVTRTGLDLDTLWERKRLAISQVKGLRVPRPRGVTFDKIRGLAAIKEHLRSIFQGRKPPRVVILQDEIEKSIKGATGGPGGDSGNSVNADALGVVLKYMQDKDWLGFLAFGPAGTGKSLLAQAIAEEFGVLPIDMDLGAMKGQYVGDSEQGIRDAMRTIEAVAGEGGALFIGACNDETAIPAELLRRYRLGLWFFDLMSAAERDDTWKLYTGLYGVEDTDRPADQDWTGAEIRNCVDMAWRKNCSLKEAGKYIVPVAVSRAKVIEKLRDTATNNWLSASYEGTYRGPQDTLGGPKKQPASRRDVAIVGAGGSPFDD